MANRLLQTTSPYLLQHAHNPVDWFPWGQEAFDRAEKENKLILLSIGYSACHWCHVMEERCFQNEAIAAFMNQHYINIKIDREERPDVDMLYLDALQLMGQRGGWPLHVFLTPDKLPFFGGTYFPPEQWMGVLEELAMVHRRNPEEFRKIGENLRAGLAVPESERLIQTGSSPETGPLPIQQVMGDMQLEFDAVWGGFGQAPKFPMPVTLDLLLYYHHLTDDKTALQMVEVTLEKMAYGGIHDQLGGGFARYSTDSEWKIPHFEKMLYDNAQLLSLYSHAYGASLEMLYRDVAFGIANFIRTELTSPEGAFYCSLDADSEGGEGKYYTWTYSEILNILGPEGEEFCRFFQISPEGNFENGTNVLWRTTSEEDFALLASNRSHPEMHKFVVEGKRKLLEARRDRPKPALDNKVLTSWNGLMCKGLIDAYRIFDQPELLKMAYDNATFIRDNLMEDSGRLYHTWQAGKPAIPGFLDDYAFTIEAFVALYEATFHEEWLHLATRLAEYCLAHFQDGEDGLFFYTSRDQSELIARKKELVDNVIPSSNATLAMGLFRLGNLFDREEFRSTARRMVKKCEPLMARNPRHTAMWWQAWLMMQYPLVEVAIVGKQAARYRKELDKIFYPNKVMCGTTGSSSLPLLENRSQEGDGTTVFVCQNQVCRLPADSISSALRQLKLIKDEILKSATTPQNA